MSGHTGSEGLFAARFRCHKVSRTPQKGVEAMTTPEGAKGWVDQAGSAHDLAGGHGLDVAPDASPDGVRAETRLEKDGAGGEPSNTPIAAYYDFRAHQWVPQCPRGDMCTGCDARGYCEWAEGEDAYLDHLGSLEDARSY